MDELYTLRLNQTLLLDGDHYVGSRYEFNITLPENKTRVVYWDPNARADPLSLARCENNSTVDLKTCRPITVHGAPAEPEKAKKSPGFGLLACVAGVAALAALRRRRAA